MSAAMPDHDADGVAGARAGWCESLQDLADVMQDDRAALELRAARPGQRVYIPKSRLDKSWLAGVIGLGPLRRLAEVFGGEYVALPTFYYATAESRRAAIEAAEGNNAEVASRFGVSTRWVHERDPASETATRGKSMSASAKLTKAKSEVRRWSDTEERLAAQLDKAKTALAEAKETRRADVLPARSGDDPAAAERVAAADGRIAELKREVAELGQALEDAGARKEVAEARLQDLQRGELAKEVAKIEGEAEKLAMQIDDALADVGSALQRVEDLILEATKLRGGPVPRRVPVQEGLRRALAHFRIGGNTQRARTIGSNLP